MCKDTVKEKSLPADSAAPDPRFRSPDRSRDTIRAHAPETYRAETPSVPALVNDVGDVGESHVDDALPNFRQGKPPWAILAGSGVMAAIIGVLSMTGNLPSTKNVAATNALAAQPPPVESVLASKAVAPVVAPEVKAVEVPKPPPAPTVRPKRSVDPKAKPHRYDPSMDPAVRFNAPKEWMGGN